MNAGRGPARLERVRTWGLNIAAPLGFLSFVLEYGFFLNRLPALLNTLRVVNVLLVAFFVVDAVAAWIRSPSPREHLRRSIPEAAMVALLALQGMLYGLALSWEGGEHLQKAVLPKITRGYILLVQVYLLVRFGFAFAELQARLGDRAIRPPQLLAASFLLLIAFGTFMLMTPRAAGENADPLWRAGGAAAAGDAETGAVHGFVNALFTSTSAACVTGLTVVDTGTAFSRTGQAWLMALIQIGGLGLATFGALFGALSARKASVRGSVMMRDLMSVDVVGQVGRFVGWTLALTFVIELAGGLLMSLWCPQADAGTGTRLWWGLFHSVSAFCNAGFGLQPDNFAGFPAHWGLNCVIMALVLLGGIGFPVMIEGVERARRRRAAPAGPARRLSLHSRLAVRTSAALVVAGALLYWALEAGYSCRGRSLGEQILVPLFHSVSCRTAGFNTVDIGALRDGTLIVMEALMVVGASPVSTGGGIKTVTVVLLGATVWSMMRGRPRVELARRTIPRLLIHSAIAIASLYFAVLFLVVLTLCVTDPEVPFRQLLFESVSALSTVGLSTGITAGLSAPGKLVLCGAMFFGRVGPLAILMSLAGRQGDGNYEYPEEGVIVG
jgi:trk system potassium uptake protein TrkH